MPVVALHSVRCDRLQLFKRLLRELFWLWSESNNLRYWDMLCRLMGAMWGEDGRPTGEEVLKPLVLQTIESLLVADDPMEDMESTSRDWSRPSTLLPGSAESTAAAHS